MGEIILTRIGNAQDSDVSVLPSTGNIRFCLYCDCRNTPNCEGKIRVLSSKLENQDLYIQKLEQSLKEQQDKIDEVLALFAEEMHAEEIN